MSQKSMKTVNLLKEIETNIVAQYEDNITKLEAQYQIIMTNLIEEKMLIQQKLLQSFLTQMNELFQLKLSFHESKLKIEQTSSTNVRNNDNGINNNNNNINSDNNTNDNINVDIPIAVKHESQTPSMVTASSNITIDAIDMMMILVSIPHNDQPMKNVDVLKKVLLITTTKLVLILTKQKKE